MRFEEFKEQFQARHREARQERDELSQEAEGILKEYKSLLELGELSLPDIKAGRLGQFLQTLKDHGFNNLGEYEEELDKLSDRLELISMKLEKLEDELGHLTVRCPVLRDVLHHQKMLILYGID